MRVRPSSPRPGALAGPVALACSLAALAVALVVPTAAVPVAGAEPPPTPSDAEQGMAAARADADRAAERLFDAMARADDVRRELAEVEERIPRLRARARELRDAARARALAAYKARGHALGGLLASDDALTAARRTLWLGRLNDADAEAFAAVRTATARLGAQRARLRSLDAEEQAAVARLRDEETAVQAKLAVAQQRWRAVQAASTPAIRPTPATAATAATTTAATTTTTTTTTTTLAATSSAPTMPVDYTGTPGTHPHHADPFLVCLRTHESSGSYTAVNQAGPYHGAYQMLQATWNSGANHMGRPELIGVVPSRATEYDQDDVAWALYRWQGTTPWGGTCA